MSADALREEVRSKYAEAARAASEGRGCGCGSGSCCEDGFGESLYSAEERGELPDAAALASLGCGNPTAIAELREGETVLDLGSGGGIDVILSARRVGPEGTRAGTPRRPVSATSTSSRAGSRSCRCPPTPSTS